VAPPEIYRTLPVIERTGRSSGPPDRSRSVTRGRNESPIFRETKEGRGGRGCERRRAQCGSLTRLLITIVPRADNELNRQKKWPVRDGGYKSPVSETMQRDMRDGKGEEDERR